MKSENYEPHTGEEEKEVSYGEGALLSGKDCGTHKLSGREGAPIARFISGNHPRVCSPPAEEAFTEKARFFQSHCKDPPTTWQPRQVSQRAAATGRPPHVGRTRGGSEHPPRRPGAQCAAGRVLPRAPTPPQPQAQGRAAPGLRAGVRGRRPRAGRAGRAAPRPGRGAASGRTMWRRRRLMGARHHGGAQ